MAKSKALTPEKAKQQAAVTVANGKYKKAVEDGRAINKKMAAEILRKGKK